MKRILSMLLTLTMVMSLCGTTIYAEGEPTVSISHKKCYAGDTVTLDVKLENNPGVASVSLDLYYDQSVLELVGVKDAGVIASPTLANTYTSFPYGLYWQDFFATTNNTSNGTFVTLDFKVSETAEVGTTAEVYVSDTGVGFIDCNMVPVEFTYMAGSITVLGEDFPEEQQKAAKVILKDSNGVEVTETEFAYAGPYTVTAADVENVTLYKVEGETATAIESDTIVDAGTYTYYTVLAADGYNTTEPLNKVTYTISEGVMKDVNVLVDGKAYEAPLTYTAVDREITLQIPEGAAINGSYIVTNAKNESVTTELKDAKVLTVNAKDVSTVAIDVTVTRSGYEPVGVKKTVEIVPAEITVDDISVTKTYNGTADVTISEDQIPTVTGLGTDEVALVGYPNSIELGSANAGTYEYTVNNLTLSNPNYKIANTPKINVTVDKAVVEITANNITKIAGMKDPELTFTYQVKNSDLAVNTLYGNDTLAAVLERAAGEDVGVEYAITCKGVTLSNNYAYTYTFVPGVFMIIEREYFDIEVTKYVDDYIVDTDFDTTANNFVVEAHYYQIDENGDKVLVDGKNVVLIDVLTDTSLLTITSDAFKTGTKMFETTGAATVTVKLTGNDKSAKVLDVNVADKVLESITLDTTAVKKAFKEGHAFTSEGLKVTGKYNNGKTYDITEFDVATANSGALVPSDEQTVTVTVGEKTAEYTIKVEAKVLQTIEVKAKEGTTIKLDGYVATDMFDFTNVEVWVTYDNFPETKVDVTTNDNTEYPTDALVAGTQTLVITYTENGVTLEDKSLVVTAAAISVKSIEITKLPAEDALTYTEGTAFEPEKNIEVKINFTRGDSVLVTENFEEKGFEFIPAKFSMGDTKVTVSYEGATADIEGIIVEPKELTDITLKNYETKYVDGENFEIAEVVATYNNGTWDDVTDEAKIDPAVVTLDTKVVTVSYTYNEKTVTKEVAVEVLPCEAINTTTGERYATVEDALTNAADGAVIELQLDAEITSDVTVPADITIETNGKNLTTADDATINTDDYTVVLVNEGSADIVLSVNGDELTVKAGETAELTDGASDEFIMIEMAKLQKIGGT